MRHKLLSITRYAIRFALAFIVIALFGYTLLFTPLGNRLMKPLVENILQSRFAVPIQLDTFHLNHDELEFHLHDSLDNTIHMEGSFSLLTLNIHAYYKADFSHLGGLNTFMLPLMASGIINGSYAHLSIHGDAHAFDAPLDYTVQLSGFNLSSLQLRFDHLDYQSMMKWLEYPHESNTTLSGSIDIAGFEDRNIVGNAMLSAHTKNFIPSPIIDDNASFDFWSLFADENGQIHPFHLDLSLKASVDELGILEQFAALPLRGDGDLQATLQGDQHRLVLDASSSIANSDTHARLHLKKLRPSYLYLNVDHADAAELFHLFSLSAPIDGNIRINAESDMQETAATFSVRNGVTHPDVLKRDYRLTQPKTRFDGSVSLKANQKQIRYQARFTSDLASLGIDNTTTHEQMLRELLKSIP